MNLRQQIIQDRTEVLAGQLHIEKDTAFMRLVHALITSRGVHDFDINDIVDGGQDKQMDLISIEEDGQTADLYVIQSKNSASFSSNALIQLHNGLRWLFERPRKEGSLSFQVEAAAGWAGWGCNHGFAGRWVSLPQMR